MLRPRIPVNPLPTGIVTPLAQSVTTSDVEPRHESSPTAAAPNAPARTTVQLTPGSVVALAAGGGAVVLVVGAVLVSMLLAVAITGVSVAVIAVVLRLLIKDLQKGR
ncbi:SpdD-like protein [Streptomyces sp. NBC_00091]|uniref:SpdD-like protein n=1 Tax=Streptomyces sp. NBC_00091 TaxID=2975648 RepID=UPI002252365C|nr:SpdD-like protein [Streptomyces sp. NBC_00091]MCX5376911.1 SpdD-like protein [Streptomyces sp. NBC_00091]